MGKTSLIQCFKKQSKRGKKVKRKMPPATIATDGVDILEWTTKVNRTDEITFNAWDFAGQVKKNNNSLSLSLSLTHTLFINIYVY